MRRIFINFTGAHLLFCCGVLSLFIFPGVSWGVPANPKGVEVSQPDGTKIIVHLRGDEFYSWHEDDKNYTILLDTTTNAWVYAARNVTGVLQPTEYKVGVQDPSKLNLLKHLTDISGVKRAKTLHIKSAPFSASFISGKRAPADPSKTPILTGTMKNLVILARFSDIPASYSQAEFSNLFNQVGYSAYGAQGSVKDYYHEVSYNKLTIQSTVSQWVTLPHGYAYYGANDVNGNDVNAEEMIIDAINALAATGFDFSTVDGNNDGDVDGLTIIHSGQGEEAGAGANYIWSHKSELTTAIIKNGKRLKMYHTEPELRDATGISRIGVICHETGHFLGLPDLYDYPNTGADSMGVGDFCLMANGSWGGPPGDGGLVPAHMSAWCKGFLGWATATQITSGGNYSLPRIEDNDTAIYAFRASAFLHTEYFLMENRQQVGYDSYLPGTGGVLIWHVDENVATNNDPEHYHVDLEEAGGPQHLEQNINSGADEDYFRAGVHSSFGDATTPNSKSYSGYNLGLLISNVSAGGDPMSFNVTLTATTKLSMGKLKAFPNPCYFDKSPAVAITGIPTDALDVKVYIYSPAGKLVRVLTAADGIYVDNIAGWDGKDGNGVKTASGLYIYLAKASNYDGVTGKVYILW